MSTLADAAAAVAISAGTLVLRSLAAWLKRRRVPTPERTITGTHRAVSAADLAPRVLVVEDMPASARAIARVLGDLGLRVDTAATAAEARKLRREHDYAIVVWDAVEDLPARERWILYSGRAEASEIGRAIGADRVVDKGAPVDALEDAVRELLAERG